MINYEKIMQMSPDELAAFLGNCDVSLGCENAKRFHILYLNCESGKLSSIPEGRIEACHKWLLSEVDCENE